MTNEIKRQAPMSEAKALDLQRQLIVVSAQSILLLEQVEKLKTLTNKLNLELKKKLQPKSN